MIEPAPDIATRYGDVEAFICRPDRGSLFAYDLLAGRHAGIGDALRDMAQALRLS